MASNINFSYEEEIVHIKIELEIGKGYSIGLFTIDLTSDPYKYMGHIRGEIGSALALSLDDFTIKNANTVVHDSYIAKIYLEETKGLYNGNLLRLDIDEDKQRDVAKKLQSRIKENKNVHDMGGTIIVMEKISEDKDVTLTIYKACFQLYVSKFL